MTTALGYQCEVSAETSLRDSQWVLDLTMSISDCLPSGYASEDSALEEPAVILKASLHPQRPAQFSLPQVDKKKSI